MRLTCRDEGYDPGVDSRVTNDGQAGHGLGKCGDNVLAKRKLREELLNLHKCIDRHGTAV